MPTTAYRWCSPRSFPPPRRAWPLRRDPTHVPAVPVNMIGIVGVDAVDVVVDGSDAIDKDVGRTIVSFV